ncbi:hypothetical protein H4R23_005854, partial [Coemansia sp. Cherry 401B]
FVLRDSDSDQFVLRDSDSDDDQFVLRDNDDDQFVLRDDDVGPAGRMGRFHSYQNEAAPAASSDDDERPPSAGSDDQGNEGCASACSDCVVVDDGALLAADDGCALAARRRLLRLSLDGSAHAVPVPAADPPGCSAGASGDTLPAYLLTLPDIPSSDIPPLSLDIPPLSLDIPPLDSPPPAAEDYAEDSAEDSAKDSAKDSTKDSAVHPAPPMPPRPSDADCASFQSNMARLAAQNPAIKLPYNPANPEPKGRVHDLLLRESKQRSLSSSELDNIVPADIASWGPAPSPERPGSDSEAGRERAGSFAQRRRRSRSQSAGVGISRAMVIQAAVQGQFPYLDAKTCQFVGQLKSDSVTLGGAAASGCARPRSKPVPPLPASPPIAPADDVPPVPLRPPSLPPSSLRMRSSAIASDSDDDGDDDSSPAPFSSPAPNAPLASSAPNAPLRTGLPTPAHSGSGGHAQQPAKHHHPNLQSEKSTSLTYAAVAMSASALPTPTIITTALPSCPPPPPPKPLSWAAVVSSSGAAEPSAGTNGRAGGRSRGQRSAAKGFGGSRVPEFPVLPMSPVGTESPGLFASKK